MGSGLAQKCLNLPKNHIILCVYPYIYIEIYDYKFYTWTSPQKNPSYARLCHTTPLLRETDERTVDRRLFGFKTFVSRRVFLMFSFTLPRSSGVRRRRRIFSVVERWRWQRRRQTTVQPQRRRLTGVQSTLRPAHFVRLLGYPPVVVVVLLPVVHHLRVRRAALSSHRRGRRGRSRSRRLRVRGRRRSVGRVRRVHTQLLEHRRYTRRLHDH